MTSESRKGKASRSSKSQSKSKGFDEKHSKHPGYDPAHPQGRNPKAVRAKVALQHIHRHGRGQG